MVCSRGTVIEPEALPRSFLTDPAVPVPRAATSERRTGPSVGGPAAEKERILRALESSHWNRGLAAAHLGIDRTTLWRKMQRLGIVPPDH